MIIKILYKINLWIHNYLWKYESKKREERKKKAKR
jgi:hypothetical protein